MIRAHLFPYSHYVVTNEVEYPFDYVGGYVQSASLSKDLLETNVLYRDS